MTAVVTFALLILSCASTSRQPTDPLPLWNDGVTKAAIIDFVNAVTTPGQPNYVSETERIAVFDNDGTLWAEQPYYFQLAFIFDRVKALAPAHPEWAHEEPFASVLNDDLAGVAHSGTEGLIKLMAATHGNMSVAEFSELVEQWLDRARHPTTGRRYTDMTYAPMVELLDYLRANGFKTFIVSGGGLEFMRPWAPEAYGIPPDQIVGSRIRTVYDDDGAPRLVRQPEIEFIDDGPGKPVGIQTHIGQRPIAAFGNSDGDYEMIDWTTSGPGLRLGVIIHHTDAEREWAYDRTSHIGRLNRGLDDAPRKGWVIVDMKDDWRVVFGPE